MLLTSVKLEFFASISQTRGGWYSFFVMVLSDLVASIIWAFGNKWGNVLHTLFTESECVVLASYLYFFNKCLVGFIGEAVLAR